MRSNEADKYKHEAKPVDIYQVEEDNIKKEKKYTISVKGVIKSKVLCRRVRLTPKSNLVLPNAGHIHNEMLVYEAIMVGDDVKEYVDIKEGDMFIAKNYDMMTVMPDHTIIKAKGKEFMACEMINGFDIVMVVEYGKTKA